MALLKVKDGDVFAIPALKSGQKGFVLSRVIVATRVICIVEVFSNFRTDFDITDDTVKAEDFSVEERLFNPVYVALDFNKFFGKIQWPILKSDPMYDKEQSGYSEIEFEESCEYDNTGLYYKGGIEYHEDPGVRRNLESKTIYSNPQLVHRINLHLNGYLQKGEPLNPKRTRAAIQQNGMDWWTDGIQACIELADDVARKFKETRRNVGRPY